MKSFFLVLVGLTLIGVNVKAQSFLDKLSSTVTKAEKTKSNYDKLKGLLPKRKVKSDSSQTVGTATSNPAIRTDTKSDSAGQNLTVISVSGVDFVTLKRLSENLQNCKGVKSSKMKYNSTSSTIDVIHSGTTENLLKLMEETSKDIFTEKNIEGFEEGKIQLKLK